MSIRSFILGAATLASVALPGVASAQGYGYYGYGNNGSYNAPYRGDRYYSDRGDDRGYYARERRDDERRRRDEERHRRWEWQHRHHDRDDYYERGYRY